MEMSVRKRPQPTQRNRNGADIPADIDVGGLGADPDQHGDLAEAAPRMLGVQQTFALR
jgi:hypothetical protein